MLCSLFFLHKTNICSVPRQPKEKRQMGNIEVAIIAAYGERLTNSERLLRLLKMLFANHQKAAKAALAKAVIEQHNVAPDHTKLGFGRELSVFVVSALEPHIEYAITHSDLNAVAVLRRVLSAAHLTHQQRHLEMRLQQKWTDLMERQLPLPSTAMENAFEALFSSWRSPEAHLSTLRPLEAMRLSVTCKRSYATSLRVRGVILSLQPSGNSDAAAVLALGGATIHVSLRGFRKIAESGLARRGGILKTQMDGKHLLTTLDSPARRLLISSSPRMRTDTVSGERVDASRLEEINNELQAYNGCFARKHRRKS